MSTTNFCSFWRAEGIGRVLNVLLSTVYATQQSCMEEAGSRRQEARRFPRRVPRLCRLAKHRISAGDKVEE